MKFQFKKMTFSHCVTFFMLFWLMNVLCIVPANAQKVHMDGKSSTVHQVMTLIESQTGYKFFYNNQVNLSRIVTIKAKNENLTSVLKRLFDGTNVSYKIIDKTIVLSIKDQKNNRTATPANVGSTKKTKITGKVTDIKVSRLLVQPYKLKALRVLVPSRIWMDISAWMLLKMPKLSFPI